ncbi:MAG: MBL fold metallo-hydrolase [Anaerolineae bacterium]|nr:MBL fold metallo-hydrolase [Anaerolineae bacterium]
MPLMLRERVSDDIYVFTSSLYAQVTAGAIKTQDGVVVVDTLPFPQESRQLVSFAQRLHPRGIRHVILTHSHADHVFGSYLFPGSELVAHQRCRDMMQRYGEASLAQAKAQTPELAEVRLRLPTLLFEGELTLRIGGKTLLVMQSPGHSPDMVMVHAKEDKVLFASDAVMPVPYLVGGSLPDMLNSLRALGNMPLENIVQGHGPVLLRGEIGEALDSSILYLEKIDHLVKDHVVAGRRRAALNDIDIEKCGKSRVPLGGLVQRLHQANLLYLYDTLVTAEKAAQHV